MKTFRLLALTFLGLFSIHAHAGIFVFDLENSVEGGERPPNYGLRLDGLYSGAANDIYTFGFVDVTMTVDSDAGTAAITGSMIGGTEGDGEARDTDWFLDFLYTGLNVDATDGSWEFQAGADGAGNVENLASNDIFGLVEFMGSDGWGPKGDGGPCRTNDGPWCGNGWVNHSITPGGDASTAPHLSASDFLYTGTPVPAPSVLALFGLGLLGLGVARRRRV